MLLAAGLIPSGRVATYGDLGRVAGVGPRQVGAILRERGSAVAWWRVVDASGTLPPALAERAAPRWDAEGVGHREGRVRLAEFRADAAALASAYRRAAGPG